MVYKLANDGVSGSAKNKAISNGFGGESPQIQIQTGSISAKILINFIKLILIIYDLISLPIYFIIQRPDLRANEAQRTRSERVDAKTWIKTDLNPNETSFLMHGIESRVSQDLNTAGRLSHNYLGSTLGEIFSNAVQEFSTRPCLGYRAVVTCPVLTMNEEGEHVMEDKSFRSDYTWYTYEQIGRRVQDIASGLYHHSVYPGSRALFMANTSLEWFIASQACFQLAAQLVVAPEINDLLALRQILEEAEVDIIFVSCDRLSELCLLFDSIQALDNLNPPSSGLPLSSTINVKTILLIDWQFSVDFSEPIFAQLRESSGKLVQQVLSMGQVEEAGVENPVELTCTKFLEELDLRQEQDSSLIAAKIISQTNEPRNNNNKSRPEKDRDRNDADFMSPPSTVPLRRRSIKKGNTSKKAHKTHLGPATNDKRQRRNISEIIKYTILDEFQLDSKSTLPRLSVTHFAESLQSSATSKISRPNDIGMLVYAHGSLGQIKAVMLTHNYLARCSHYLFLDGLVNGKDVHCSTLSADNIIEFMTEMCVFSHGGSIGYSCNSNTLFYDGKELFKRDSSDLEALNPTFLLLRPYHLERLRSSLQNYINLNLNPLTSFVLSNVLYDYKKYWARRHFKTPIVNWLFCDELKRLFGNKIEYILCNGATDCSETKDFFAFIINIPVIESYSPDEAVVSLISVNDIWDYKRRLKNKGQSWHDDREDHEQDFRDIKLMPPTRDRNTFNMDSSKNLLITSSILCPALGSRIRLEDWEDFRISDQPYPRGRLVIGGDVVCKGYYKRPTLTKESFYMDSNFITWFRTNDIARGFPNGSFEIISSMTDMIKMVDGQFISLSQIEHILKNSQFVDNVCAICGDDRKFVIALVVPNLRRLALKSPGEANLKMAIGMDPEPEELLDIEFRREVCNDRLLCEFVNEHLTKLIAKAGFQSIPSSFYLVPEMWTPETELVTPAFEPKRAAIQKYYAADIQSIFKMRFTPTRKKLSARPVAPRKFSNPLN